MEINANARMYEPATGRFLTADPYVQAPDYSQNYNRYSYCLNNPLVYTDPSGEIIAFTETGYDFWKSISPVAIKVDVGFGEHTGIGVRVSVGVPQIATLSVRGEAGAGYWWKNGEIPEGWMFTYGYEIGISPFIIVGSTNYFTPSSPEFNQRTGHARIGIPGFNIKYENDGVMWFLGDGGDRYRTAGAKIQVGVFSIGVNLFTGDPGLDGDDREKQMIDGKLTYVKNPRTGDNPDSHRAGIGYIGIGQIRFGNNKESRRHKIQNILVHDNVGAPHFRVLDRPNSFYFQFGTGGGYLW